MDAITLVAVGIDDYPISTMGLIASIHAHEPTTQLVIVDNAATIPYPTGCAEVVRLTSRVSMAAAMNAGAKVAKGDWLIFGNNDIYATAPFAEMVSGLDKSIIYGVDPLDWWGRFWLDGWVMAISRQVWEAVGEFDEAFLYAGFEDADYCFRAQAAGFGVQAYPLPFIHKELHSRFSMPGYMKQRERNIEYLCQKWGIQR